MSIPGFSKLSSLPALMFSAIWLVRICCVVGVLYVIVDAFWYFTAGPKEQAATPGYANVADFQSQRINTDQITSTELFGTNTKVEPLEPLEDLKATTLNLTLEGTFIVEDDPTLSIALISSQSSRAQVRDYQVGDAVASFAELEAIHPRFVVISRGGERERLAFETDTILKPSSTAFSAPAPSPTIRSESASRLNSRLQTRMQSARSTPERISRAREFPPNFTIEQLKSLGLSEIQTERGSVLQITNATASSPLARLGMQPGDIVLSVNGYPVEEFRNDVRLAEEVANSRVARLEIQRAGRQFMFAVPIP